MMRACAAGIARVARTERLALIFALHKILSASSNLQAMAS
jgi:hypothetical protein